MIFGIDVGIASVGSCVLELHNQEDNYQGMIKHVGVRLFDAGENAKDGKALNADYREHRGTRKRLRRTKHRKELLQKLFKQYGLIDKVNLSKNKFSLLKPSFILPQDAKHNTWKLRTDGLERALNKEEWASVLYYLVKHRGFQSNSKKEDLKDKETGKALSAISDNQKLLAEKNYQTFGEMLYKDEKYRNRKRNTTNDYANTVNRTMVEDELNKLFDKQAEYNNPYTSLEFKQKVIEILNKRKPTFTKDAIKNLIEYCNFEPNEQRCVKNSYYAEKFVLSTKLNNLVIQGIMQTQDRVLTDDEKQKIIDKIYAQKELTYTGLRKLLNIDDSQRFNLVSYSLLGKSKEKKKSNKKAIPAIDKLDNSDDLNNSNNEQTKSELEPKVELKYEIKDIEDKTFFSAKAYHDIKKQIKDEIWQKIEQLKPEHKHEILHAIAYVASLYKQDDDFYHEMQINLNKLQQDYNIDADLIQSLLNKDVLYKLLDLDFTGTVNLSVVAIKKILPYMQDGQRYDEAVKSAGYEHHSKKISQGKKYLAKPLKKEIRNPVVYRSINQAVKVINALIKEYGKPEAIHIELARDLTKNFQDRKKQERENEENLGKNQEANNSICEEYGIDNGSNYDILKFKLYKQQQGQCAYSQQSINLAELLSNKYEIDHILPFSRSFDDSQNNKVLVCIKHNQQKGNRTPYEYLSSNAHDWQAFEAWVNAIHSIPYAKKRRLLTQESKFGGFVDRNLNDTRYIAKEINSRVNQELGIKTVNIQGGITSVLRKKWGLNKLKNREENSKHHALDAAIIAACTKSMVQRMQEYSKAKELKYVANSYIDTETGEVLDLKKYHNVNKHFPQPYEGFRNELIALLNDNPKQYLEQNPVGHYTKEQLARVKPLFISHMERKSTSGKMHDDTIRSYNNKGLQENQSSKRTSLTDLSPSIIKDILENNAENTIKDASTRQRNLVQKLQERLEELRDNLSQYEKGDKLKKKLTEIFKQPLYLSEKLSKKGNYPVPVKSITVLNNGQKSGMLVRGGIADRSEMLRLDIFSKVNEKGTNKGKTQYFGVPVYAHQAYDTELPKAINADASNLVDESYTFCFSLHKDSFIRLVEKNGDVLEGYYASFDIDSGRVSYNLHDNSNSKLERISILNLKSFEKKYVDILGKCYNIEKHSERLPIKNNNKKKI